MAAAIRAVRPSPGRPPMPYRFFFGFFCSFFIDVPLDIRGLLDPAF
jgi:hypothetical protein